MGRSGQHRRRATFREGADVKAVIIDRYRYGVDTVVLQHYPVQPEPRVLHRHRLIRQHRSEQRDGLRRP